jgi:hypothetical protein
VSADNELAVVKFPDGFRVVEIRGCPSEGDLSFIREFYPEFVASAIFGTEELAMDYAVKLFDAMEECPEYGITAWESPEPLIFYCTK